MKVYKYACASLARKILKDKYFLIKFDHPKNYNDPHELFLTPTETSDPYVFAFYNRLIAEIPQLPTTCFSRRPDVLPMWAHYGNNQTGFVIEIDETELVRNIEAGVIEDVTYLDEVIPYDLRKVQHAATTLKPRHLHFTRSEAFRSAYFTKNALWSYEKERRLVLDESQFAKHKKNLILPVPSSCITAIIGGYKISELDRAYLNKKAKDYNCPYRELSIGKSTIQPYFVGSGVSAGIFDGQCITPAPRSCAGCGDPFGGEELECPWCRMTNEESNAVIASDPMRLYDHFGKINPYGLSFYGLNPVGRRYNKEDMSDSNS